MKLLQMKKLQKFSNGEKMHVIFSRARWMSVQAWSSSSTLKRVLIIWWVVKVWEKAMEIFCLVFLLNGSGWRLASFPNGSHWCLPNGSSWRRLWWCDNGLHILNWGTFKKGFPGRAVEINDKAWFSCWSQRRVTPIGLNSGPVLCN